MSLSDHALRNREIWRGLAGEYRWADDDQPAGETLVRDYFGIRSIEDRDGSTTFHLPYGEWIALLRANGLVLEDVLELRPGENPDPGSWDFVTLDWARRWPSEEIWKARKAA